MEASPCLQEKFQLHEAAEAAAAVAATAAKSNNCALQSAELQCNANQNSKTIGLKKKKNVQEKFQLLEAYRSKLKTVKN